MTAHRVSAPACSEHGAAYVVGPILSDGRRPDGTTYGYEQVFQCVRCGAQLRLPLPTLPEPRRPRVVAVLPDGSWIEDGPGGRTHVSPA